MALFINENYIGSINESFIKDFINKIINKKIEKKPEKSVKKPKAAEKHKFDGSYDQLCIICNLIVENTAESKKEFNKIIDFFKSKYDVRIKFEDTFETVDGKNHHVIISCHDDDLKKMGSIKSSLGVRWFEDYYFQNEDEVPNNIKSKYRSYMEPLRVFYE